MIKWINKFTMIIIFLIFSCDSKEYGELKKTTYTDKNNVFSVTAPKSWNSNIESNGNYSVLELKTNKPYHIQLRVTSRILEENEKNLNSLKLMDQMLNSSLSHLKSEDCQIIDVGKATEFKKGWPTFVIVAATESGEVIITQWGSVIEDRNLSVNLFTRNLEGSEELSKITRQLVESLRFLK